MKYRVEINPYNPFTFSQVLSLKDKNGDIKSVSILFDKNKGVNLIVSEDNKKILERKEFVLLSLVAEDTIKKLGFDVRHKMVHGCCGSAPKPALVIKALKFIEIQE